MFANINSRRFYFLFFLSIIFLILISPIASWAKWKPALPQFVLVQTSVDSEGLDANQLKEEADKLYQEGKYREALPLFEKLAELVRKYLGLQNLHPSTGKRLRRAVKLALEEGEK